MRIGVSADDFSSSPFKGAKRIERKIFYPTPFVYNYDNGGFQRRAGSIKDSIPRWRWSWWEGYGRSESNNRLYAGFPLDNEIEE